MASTSEDMTMMRRKKRTDLWFVQEGVVGGSNFRLLDHRGALFSDHLTSGTYYDCHDNCQNCHHVMIVMIFVIMCNLQFTIMTSVIIDLDSFSHGLDTLGVHEVVVEGVNCVIH